MLVVAPPRAARNCARIWSITDCEGRLDFSGLEKSRPSRSVSLRELSKLSGVRLTSTSSPDESRTKRSGNAASIVGVTVMLEIGRSIRWWT